MDNEPLDGNSNKQSRAVAPRRELSNAADAMGLWFAAVVLGAVLAAGVIVYQTGNSDLVTASNEATPTHGTAH